MALTCNPTVIDLFAGAGVFSAAFHAEGFEVVRAVELNGIAAATHAANLPSPVDVADVAAIEPTGRCDVLVAGPPCQGFSTLGKRLIDDPRNRLCLQVPRWAKVLRPDLIVVENVAPFLKSPVWGEMRRLLCRMGYEVEPVILDAVDFGVPQRRRRSFTFASRVGLPTIGRSRGTRLTLRQAWRRLAPTPDGKNSHIAPVPKGIAMERMKLIPAGGDKRDILRLAPHLAPPSWHRTYQEVTDVWGRLNWDAPANTLRTALLNPSKGRYIHPEQNRVISLREAARLHSIPDDWAFIGTPYQVARQIGNSVPPRLGREVARAVRRQIAATEIVALNGVD